MNAEVVSVKQCFLHSTYADVLHKNDCLVGIGRRMFGARLGAVCTAPNRYAGGWWLVATTTSAASTVAASATTAVVGAAVAARIVV